MGLWPLTVWAVQVRGVCCRSNEIQWTVHRWKRPMYPGSPIWRLINESWEFCFWCKLCVLLVSANINNRSVMGIWEDGLIRISFEGMSLIPDEFWSYPVTITSAVWQQGDLHRICISVNLENFAWRYFLLKQGDGVFWYYLSFFFFSVTKLQKNLDEM